VLWKGAHANKDTTVEVPAGACPEKFHLPLEIGLGEQAEFEDFAQPVSADDFAELDYSMKDD